MTVVGGTTPAEHDGWMWNLTVPDNNDHDFYVISDSDVAAPNMGSAGHHTRDVSAGAMAVLVHNCGSTDLNYSQIRQRIINYVLVNHGDTVVEGAKFASNFTQNEGKCLFNGLVNRISEDNATGVTDATGNREHILSWPGAGANGENFVRVWTTPDGMLGSMWQIIGP